MSIFNTAIQTLSNVAIQEAGITLPDVANTNLVEDMKAKLDGMDYLTEDEMRFTVEMVPVRENRRLGKYLIEMEDLSRYMITNRITSLTEAVGHILECNDLVGQYDNIALVIDEASILDEMAALGIDPKDGDYPEVQTGIGQTVFGDPRALKDIRRIANSKEVLDKMFNNYGLPFIKKNYKQVGLLETVEDVKMDAKPGDKVLQEKDKKPSGSASVDEAGFQNIAGYSGIKDNIIDPKNDDLGVQKAKYEAQQKWIASQGGQPSDSEISSAIDQGLSAGGKHGHNESYELSEHDRHIQYLRDVVAGKYDSFREGKHMDASGGDPSAAAPAASTAGYVNHPGYKGIADNIIDPKNDDLGVQKAKQAAQEKWMMANAPISRGDERDFDPRM